MPLYEHVFLARQDVSSQQVENLADQFKSIVEEAGGTVSKVENWGLKTLTYRVKKNRKAHFTLMNIDASHDAMAEVERQQRLSEDVLRSLTLRVDEHEEGPSAMMRKREERGDRRGGRFGDRERPRRDGPRSDGPRSDGPRGDGPRGDGPKSDASPAAEKPANSGESS